MLQRLKKIISALTVTAMIFGIMPIGAFAENLNKADYEELNDGKSLFRRKTAVF